jgi:integrase
VWWVDYGVRGERHRESSGSTSRRAACDLLRDRITKRKDGTLAGKPERVTLSQLKDVLERHYLLEGNASWDRAKQAFVHLTAHFGATRRAVEITTDDVAGFQEARLKAKAARNTVKYETSVLNAAFGAAAGEHSRILSAKIVFKNLPDDKEAVRQGYFEPGDFAALTTALPVEIADVARFAIITGWRRGEITGLLWAQVDWDGTPEAIGACACVKIGRADTKGGDARHFPITGGLDELLVSRWKARNGPYVFHQAGAPILTFGRAWVRACKTAGVPGKLFHDLRRTAAREYRRAGVSEGVIMALCGWRTRAMFSRYDIRNDDDLRQALRDRNGKEAARKAAVTTAVE